MNETLIARLFIAAYKAVMPAGRRTGRQAELAAQTGISQSRISNMIAGRRIGTEVQRRVIAAALGYPGRAYEDFLDIGRQILAEAAATAQPAPTQIRPILVPAPLRLRPLSPDKLKADYFQIPFRDDLCLAAGAGAAPEGFYQVENSPVVIHKSALRRCRAAALKAFRVGGNSMEPTIRQNGIVVVDMSPRYGKTIKDEGIYMLHFDDEYAVKRLRWAKAGKMLAIVSDNQDFDIVYREVGEIDLLGRVIWSWGEHYSGRERARRARPAARR